MKQTSPSRSMPDLSPWDFDQSPSGWRALAEDNRFLEAEQLIQNYIHLHMDQILEHKEKRGFSLLETMQFHRGQLLAFIGQDYWPQAIEAFNHALYLEGKTLWNAYVSATIGYLQQDRQKLLDAIAHIEQSDNPDKRSGNLEIIQRLLQALDAGLFDYRRAYTGQDSHQS